MSQETNQPNLLSLKEAQAKVAAAEKIEDVKEVVASVLSITEAIAQESERLVAERDAEKAKLAESEAAKAEVLANAAKIQEELAQVKATLSEMQAAQAAAEAEARFNQRMSAIDATFVLTDEEKALLVSDIKDIDDEAFAKWMSKQTVLMAEKTKAHRDEVARLAAEAAAEAAKKQKKASDDNDKDDKTGKEDDNDNDAEGKKAKAAAAAAVASAATNANADGTLLSAASVEGGKDLREELKRAFEEGVKIGGKSLKEIKESRKTK